MIELLRRRRSIRKYEKRAIEGPAMDVLKEALLRCPTSRGNNPWTFIFVDDPGLLGALSAAKQHGSTFLKGAALGIVVLGDETKSDVWVEDCSIASIVVQLAAHSLGLGSCWIQIRQRPHSGAETAEDYVRGVLGIPSQMRVECIISVGYPAEAREVVAREELEYGKIRHNRYV